MGGCGDNRVVVELCKYLPVACIRQVLNYHLERMVDTLDLLIVTSMEEYLDRIRPVQQIMVLAVSLNLLGDILQHDCIHLVLRIFNDNLLAVDVALLAQTQHTHGDILVEVNVEDGGVFVGFIGKEHGDRGEHYGGDGLSEPYLPLSVARHTHTRVVEDVIHDKHHHGYHYRHTQSTLTDDGTQGCSDEEEDQARQRQGELLDGFNLVMTVVTVEVFGIFHLHLHVCHHLLHTCQGALHGSLLCQSWLLGIDGVEGLRVCSQSLHQL